MIDFLRRFRLTYSVYNFFHRGELYHNVPLYKKLGLKKKYYSPVSSRDFKRFGKPGLYEVKAEALAGTAIYSSASAEDQLSMLNYNDNGFCILHNYLEPAKVQAINEEISRLLAENKVRSGYGGKIMFAIHHSELLRTTANDARLKELLNVLLGGSAVLFQSINFVKGSEQDTHSDSIHMTTFPEGGLLGVWLALEDIDDDNGPLHYYPGSHRLPYYMNADYNNEGNSLMIGNQSYRAYEQMIEKKIAERGLKKQVFRAKAGDLLIWHANLFHGGEPHLNNHKTRKSVVFHYFKENTICYHEITQRPALIKRFS